MKVPVPIKISADFESFNQPQNDPKNLNVLFKQMPIAVGFYFTNCKLMLVKVRNRLCELVC